MGEKQQWPSLKERSVSLSLNLEQHNLALVMLQKPSSVQSARVRSLLLLKERIGKTKIVCLIWLERLSKSLRKLKKEQSLPWFCKQFTSSQSLNPSSLKLEKISRDLKILLHPHLTPQPY